MLMILVQWILRKTPNHLSQYRLGVQLDLCMFGALPIRHSSNDKCPSVRQNELLRPSSLLHRSPLIYFWLLSGSTPESCQVLPILHPLLLLLRVSSLLEASEEICVPNCNVAVGGFTGLQDTRKFWPEINSLSTGLSFLSFLARHSKSNWCFQFLTSILDGFPEFLILRVNEIDPSQFSCVLKTELIIWPLMLLLQLGILSHFLPAFWP